MFFAIKTNFKIRKIQDLIGTAKEASDGDWIKICAIYNCETCQGKKFDAKNHDRPPSGGDANDGGAPSTGGGKSFN